MFSPNERAKIIALINREVVPAIGCTEPIAVALCTARAAELLDTQPEKIEVRLSANILKNAMGVGIPGTGMIGLRSPWRWVRWSAVRNTDWRSCAT